MSSYCISTCPHLDADKKRCREFKRKLAYSKQTGAVNFTVFEKCPLCRMVYEMTLEEYEAAIAAVKVRKDGTVDAEYWERRRDADLRDSQA